MASGRQPRGSRAAISVSPIATIRLYAPSTPVSASAKRSRRRVGVRPRESMDDDFRIVRRPEDRALLLELEPQLAGVDEVAVVRERDVPALRSRHDRLRVLDRRRARRAVARVSDRGDARKLEQLLADGSRTACPCCARRAPARSRRSRRRRPIPVRDAATSTGRAARSAARRRGREHRIFRTLAVSSSLRANQYNHLVISRLRRDGGLRHDSRDGLVVGLVERRRAGR